MDKHTTISFVKSGVRILGFIILLVDTVYGVVLLIVAETLGILEEL